MEKQLHTNFIKSSYLICGSAGIGLIFAIFFTNMFSSILVFSFTLVPLLIISGIGYLTRLGKGWTKYFVIVIVIMDVYGIPSLIFCFQIGILFGIISIVQIVMRVWALILLLKIPKPMDNSTPGQL